MLTITMTSSGKITLPKEIRDYLGIKQNDLFDFVVVDSETVKLIPINKQLKAAKKKG